MSVPIQDGIYQIFNVAYPGQDADLIYPGGNTGAIGGWQNNSDSLRMQWEVTNLIDLPVAGQVTFLNQEISTYAGVSLPPELFSGTPVIGDPTSTVVWAVGIPPELLGGSQYVITLFDTNYVWTLSDGTNGAPITLEVAIPGDFQSNQLWTFVQLD